MVGMTRMLPSFPLLLLCCGGGMTWGRLSSCNGGMATSSSESLLSCYSSGTAQGMLLSCSSHHTVLVAWSGKKAQGHSGAIDTVVPSMWHCFVVIVPIAWWWCHQCYHSMVALMSLSLWHSWGHSRRLGRTLDTGTWWEGWWSCLEVRQEVFPTIVT